MTNYVEIHALQSVPPSNLNRDDTGSPKSAIIGGHSRIRVSSQAWKRAIRDQFIENAIAIGTRTKQIGQLVSDRVEALNPDFPADDARALANFTLIAAGLAKADKSGEAVADAVAFISDGQVDAVAEIVIEHAELIRQLIAEAGTKKPKGASDETADETADGAVNFKTLVKAALSGSVGLDLALFGRMFATDKDLNVDATSQLSHAFSVHAADPEYDFFTAVDELKSTSGSAMMGTTEFSSVTFYRQANVNVDALRSYVGDDYIEGVQHFIRSFIESMPTGKQNSFSNKTLPTAVVITIRDSAPRNYVDAFTNPVEAGETSILETAVNRLVSTATEFDAAYGAGTVTYVIRVGDETSALDALGERGSLTDTLDKVGTHLRENR